MSEIKIYYDIRGLNMGLRKYDVIFFWFIYIWIGSKLAKVSIFLCTDFLPLVVVKKLKIEKTKLAILLSVLKIDITMVGLVL